MTFAEALAALSDLAPRGWRLGLDRMHEFVRLAGLKSAIDGHHGPRFVHVAGTNGKGSVTATLQSLMIAQGYQTGAFFSPYVYDPRERVQINRDLISEDAFAELTQRLLQLVHQMDGTKLGGVTEFELKTAIGFAAWAEAKCEWVALEVGLGGRLDSTNVVQSAGGCIVSIGWDHMNVLGDSLEKIAFEKAGIAKPGVPLVVGNMDSGPREVILGHAADVGAPVWLWARDVVLSPDGEHQWRLDLPTRSWSGLTPSLVGTHQPHNMALAVAALEAAGGIRDVDAVADGVRNASLPGRFEQRNIEGKTVVLDGAHNLDSAEALVATLRQEYPSQPITLVTGMLVGHEEAPFYRQFEGLVERVIVSPIDFHRRRDPEQLADALRPILGDCEVAEDAGSAVERALETVSPQGVIVVTGSFYLVGEVGRYLANRGLG